MEEENGRHGWKLSGDSEGTPQWERAFGPRNLCVVQMSWRDFHGLDPRTKFPAPVYREMLSSAAGIGEPP